MATLPPNILKANTAPERPTPHHTNAKPSAADIDDAMRRVLRVPPHDKPGGSGKATMRSFLKERDEFKDCFMPVMDRDPQMVVIDGTWLLCTHQPHMPKKLAEQERPYTCRDFLDDFRKRVARSFYDYGNSVTAVAVVFDIAEFVAAAKACEQRKRRQGKQKTNDELLSWVQTQGHDTVAQYFGDAYYDRVHTSMDADERAARIAECDAQLKTVESAQKHTVFARRKALSCPTLEDMLHPDKPLPGPFSALLSDKKRGLRCLIRWVVRHVSVVPETCIKLKPSQLLLWSGHCLLAGDFDTDQDQDQNQDDDQSDQDQDQSDEGMELEADEAQDQDQGQDDDEDEAVEIFTTPVIVTRSTADAAQKFEFDSRYQNFCGEGDYAMFFLIDCAWRYDYARFNTFVVRTTDTDAITAGLMYLACNVHQHPHTAMSLYNMYAPMGKPSDFCALHQLYNNVEAFISGNMPPTPKEPVRDRRGTLHMLSCSGADETMEALADAVDAIADQWPYDTVGSVQAVADPVPPVCHFVGLMALFASDFSRSWPKVGFARMFNALQLFPHKVLPLVERQPVTQQLVYNPAGVYECLTCAYTFANQTAFPDTKGSSRKEKYSVTRLANIEKMTPAQRCAAMWNHRKDTKKFRTLTLDSADAAALCSLYDSLPMGPIAMTFRVLNCEYFLALLQQTGRDIVVAPDERDYGFLYLANGDCVFADEWLPDPK
jgi:hypothetical protein